MSLVCVQCSCVLHTNILNAEPSIHQWLTHMRLMPTTVWLIECVAIVSGAVRYVIIVHCLESETFWLRLRRKRGIWNYQRVITEYRVCRRMDDFSCYFFFLLFLSVWSNDNLLLCLFNFTFFPFACALSIPFASPPIRCAQTEIRPVQYNDISIAPEQAIASGSPQSYQFAIEMIHTH